MVLDSERLLQEGQYLQHEEGLSPPSSPPTSIKLWAWCAAILVLISVSIEIFWPLPQKKLPYCDLQNKSHLDISQSCVLKSK